MDHALCCVIYIDDRVKTERWVKKDIVATSAASQHSSTSTYFDTLEESAELHANVGTILTVFSRVYMCKSGQSFSSKLAELNESVAHDCTPIFALFDVGSDARSDHLRTSETHTSAPQEVVTPSPTSLRRELTFSSESDESYGLQLLSRISSDVQVQDGPKLIIPVAILRAPDSDVATPHGDTGRARGSSISSAFYQASESTVASIEENVGAIDPKRMLRCLDAGAVDVLTSPLDKARVLGLTVHAYRVHKVAHKEQSSFLASRRRRKHSWVGVDDHKPYAYLREAMVSKLMKGICNPEEVIEDFQDRGLSILDARKPHIASEVGKWDFSAHDFSEDELVYGAQQMLKHALSMPELEKWRLSTDDLQKFLQASRAAYNSFVLYHNFRHAVDVLQSLFYFLLQIGILPPYPLDSTVAQEPTPRSPIANLLKPFDALTLLISAIGHDVGHPGVNNMFLVKLNAPLAQLYNDASVLEAFHCAAYSQILRRHWPAAFEDKRLRNLLISSILATDMGVHSRYIADLGNLQEKLHHNKGTDGWDPKVLAEYKTLACGLLIKCADISNVARPWKIAERWTDILQREFANQGEMEKEVGMETTLFGGPPVLGDLLKLANGQISFMGLFAYPLFEAVTDILPGMKFAADEILVNKDIWTGKAEKEKRKEFLRKDTGFSEGLVSPRSQSPVATSRRAVEEDTQTRDSQLREPSVSGPSNLDGASSPRGLPADPPANAPCDSPRSSLDSITGLMSGASHDQSRRSSLGSPFGLPTTNPDPTSRRSSGAFPAANVTPMPPPLQGRRSSNTLPHSQLHLAHGNGTSVGNGNGSGGDNGDPPALMPRFGLDGSDENTPPRGRRSSQNSPILAAAMVYTSPSRGSRGSQNVVGQEVSSNEHSPAKYEPTRRFHNVNANRDSQYRHTQHSSGRISVPSTNYDRHSQATSGGRTYSTVMTPVSPSTQATSFLTVDSDEKDLDDDSSRPTSAGMPTMMDYEHGRARDDKNNVRTTVIGNGIGGDAVRTMPRRRSRFRLAFWKKDTDSGGC